MVYLYKDFYSLILRFCDDKTMYMLGSCCKNSWNALKDIRKTYKAGFYTLKPLQNFIREQIRYSNIIFQAPMSYGKTATGLCIAFDGWKLDSDRERELCIIIVPSKAFGVWKEEAIKMYGKHIYNKYGSDSPLLIPYSAENNNHISQLVNGNISNKTFAILLTNSVCRKYLCLLRNKGLNKFLFIVDEAHTGTDWRLSIAGDHLSRFLIMSASPIVKKDIESLICKQTKYYLINDEIMKGKIPELEYKIVNTKEIELYLHTTSSVLDMKKYCMEIYNILKLMPNKNIVIFIPGGKPIENSRRYLEKICDKLNRDYYEFKQESKKKFEQIKNFEESSSSILVIPHSQSEAININADGAIVIRGDWVNQERINQMIGRVRRTTNKNNSIPIYQVVPKGYPNLKTKYTNACNKLGLHSSNSTIQPDFLFQSFRFLNFLDPGLKNIKPIDIVIVCNQVIGCNFVINDGIVMQDYLLDKWLKGKYESGFTDEDKKRILNHTYLN